MPENFQPAGSMKGLSTMCLQTRSKTSKSAISSPGSAAGQKLSGWPGGLQMSLFGQDHAHVNPFRWQGLAMAMKMKGISGRNSPGSSASWSLQSSLASRLRRNLDVNGSPEYVLTWRLWATPSGPPICALQASRRHTAGNGCIGWPSPTANDSTNSGYCYGKNRKKIMKLPGAAMLVGWPTATARDACGGRDHERRGYGMQLSDVRKLIPWATPTVNDSKCNGTRSQQNRNSAALNVQAHGLTATTLNADKGNTDASRLNPRFSLWLMGYRTVWAHCAEQVTRLFPKSPPSSSLR